MISFFCYFLLYFQYLVCFLSPILICLENWFAYCGTLFLLDATSLPLTTHAHVSYIDWAKSKLFFLVPTCPPTYTREFPKVKTRSLYTNCLQYQSWNKQKAAEKTKKKQFHSSSQISNKWRRLVSQGGHAHFFSSSK